MMSKHPYEFGGILFTIAVLGGILGGVAFDNYFPHGGWKDVVDNGVHEMMMTQKPSSPSWSDYYKNNNDVQLDCKRTSINLQEFYDCVNG